MKTVKDLLREIINLYQVEAIITSSTEENISEILDAIRGLKGVTTLKNITPPNFPTKEKIEYTKILIKFISKSGKPEQDVEEFKNRMLKSSKTELKIPGIIAAKFDPNSLKRI